MNKILFTAPELLPRLISEFGYPQAGAKLIAEKLTSCNIAIQTAFWEWWQTGQLSLDIEVEGFTLESLIHKHQMKPVAAFLTMDWLMREPIKARQSLQKGHDFVVPSNTNGTPARSKDE